MKKLIQNYKIAMKSRRFLRKAPLLKLLKHCFFSWKSFLYAGEGMGELSVADRATIANMSPEYGATMGFFPVDHMTLEYLKLTGRSDDTVSI